MGGYQTWGPSESQFDAVLLGISLLLSLAGTHSLMAWLLTHVHPWLTPFALLTLLDQRVLLSFCLAQFVLCLGSSRNLPLPLGIGVL